MRTSHWRNDLALLFVVLVWGVNYPVIKTVLEVMPPHVVNLFRFTVSAAVLGGVYAVRRHQGEAQPLGAILRAHGGKIVLLGLLGYVFYQLCFIIGVAHTTAGSAALIMAASPLWTALFSRVAGYEHLRRLAWAGLGLSLAGTALVVAAGAQGVDLAGGSLYGNLLMLAGSLLWGAFTAFNTPVVRHVSPAAVTFLGLLVALPFLMGLGVAHLGAVDWTGVTPWVWVAIVFSGGLSTGLTYVIWNQAVKDVGASSTAVYSNLVPFVALLGGVLFLQEMITPLQVAGGALIIAGLVVLRRSRRQVAARERVATKAVAGEAVASDA